MAQKMRIFIETEIPTGATLSKFAFVVRGGGLSVNAGELQIKIGNFHWRGAFVPISFGGSGG